MYRHGDVKNHKKKNLYLLPYFTDEVATPLSKMLENHKIQIVVLIKNKG